MRDCDEMLWSEKQWNCRIEAMPMVATFSTVIAHSGVHAGGGAFQPSDAIRERNYHMGSVFAFTASGIPFVDSERHRLITSLYGGIGKNLDRFSTFRLPGRPTGYAWEALALPMLPSVAFKELYPRRYGIAHVEYRYEALFFGVFSKVSGYNSSFPRKRESSIPP